MLYGKLRPNLNKVYLAEEQGICSTDILVLRFVSADDAKYYANYMRTSSFNAEVLKGVSGQQLPRTSWSHIQNIAVPKLSAVDLRDRVSAIKKVESALHAAQIIIDAAPAKKQAVMQKYL